ncbi:MAG: type I DNA topoisomerase [Flavobacteriales bacterium]|nr:type I DNA topoisomerase [Flavobacteriales bacterium]
MAKNLVIVESPAKAKTIEGFLGKDFVVKSSFGHVRDLKKKGLGIDIENNFVPSYEISPDKKSVVADLRKSAKAAQTVWLATDEDREGEAISWHLHEVLDLGKKETKRIVFNEITKSAILEAVANPREIDNHLVDAQQARRILDRLVGFELSPVLWRKIKPSLSAGRVQSVAVRIIVERERAIESFKTQSSYKVVAEFSVGGNKVLRAELDAKFKIEKEALEFLENCGVADFHVADLQVKPGKRSPTAPFTTSTLQQEASRKLGFSVSRTMTVAQRLYESGKITYMRTDSVSLSKQALGAAKDEIINSYGSEYANPKQYVTKAKGAQEAHEAIRPTYMNTHEAGIDNDQRRLYDLIWKRTISSQMADAQLEKTTVKVEVSNRSETFVARGEVIKFDGFLKVYLESRDDDNSDSDSGIIPPVAVGEVLEYNKINATERFTHHPARFSEATLVKQLEENGIGRPSTYAPTISTVQKRGYVVKEEREGTKRNYQSLDLINGSVSVYTKTETTGHEKGKLYPTDIGIVVNDFLVENFSKIMDLSFTASVEKQFDEIATGAKSWSEMIQDFYTPFHEKVEYTLENAERAKGERVLGKDPKTGEPVVARIGKFGAMIQIGDGEDDVKPRFAGLQKGMTLSSVTFEEAMKLFDFPKTIGQFEGDEVVVAHGRFGPYVKVKEMFVSIPRDEDISSVDIERAIELIKEKLQADAPVAEYEGLPVQKGTGRFGPFIKWNSMFINVSKKYDFDNLSQNEIIELIEIKKRKEIDKYIHRWDDKGISLQKARWGRFNIIKGKIKIELPKGTNVEDMTLADVEKIIEDRAPKKKAKAKAKPKAKKKK